jgi:T5SS/PEP-CTERM-associated repeat protein
MGVHSFPAIIGRTIASRFCAVTALASCLPSFRAGLRLERLAALGLAFVALSSSWTDGVIAQNKIWIGASGDWALGTNWSPAGAPSSGVDIEINNSGTATLQTTGQSARIYLGRASGNAGTLNVLTGGQLSSGNVLVGDSGTGAASLDHATWTAGAFTVGNFGTGTLEVKPGGMLTSSGSSIGAQPNSTGTATVEGAASKWKLPGAADNLTVGGAGRAYLYVQQGGTMEDEVGIIAASATSHGEAHIDAATWTNRYQLTVGDLGWGQLYIDNGGTVTTTSNAYVGRSADANASIDMTGNSTLSVGGVMYVGNASTVNGAFLTVGTGSNVSADGGISIGELSGSKGVAGVNGTMKTNGTLTIGNSGAGTLFINGLVENNNGFAAYIGRASGSTGTVTLDGTSAKWKHSYTLEIGSSGDGTLNIIGGSTVENPNNSDVYIGRNGGSIGHANVTTSAWTTNGEFNVGYSGTGYLNVLTGGSVQTVDGYIGRQSLSSGTVKVDAGSTWTNTGSLYVGYEGTGIMDVDNGGSVTSVNGNLGYLGGAGTATIDGTAPDDSPSEWICSGDLSVGRFATGHLNVSGGANVQNAFGYIGRSSGSFGAATIDGKASLWKNTSELTVGSSATGLMDITGGGAVESTNGYIGKSSGSGASVVNVIGFTPDQSRWTNSGELNVGNSAKGTLNITGANVENTTGYISRNSGATDSVATVGGTGGLWTNSEELYVGYSAPGALNVNTGGRVENTNGYLGRSSGVTSTANVGAAGVWKNTGELYVGNSGTGKLNITGGGVVESNVGYVGRNSSSINNEVTIDGINGLQPSSWTIGGHLYAAYAGKGTVTVSGKGKLSSVNGYIGYQGSNSNGAVTVKNSLSKWTASGDITIGREGTGVLNIEDGGTVENTSATIGGTAAGANGTVNVKSIAGAGTATWINHSSLTVSSLGTDTGKLNITGDALVKCTAGLIGPTEGLSGTVTVDHGQWETDTLKIGILGIGKLDIKQGGTVKVLNSGNAVVGDLTTITADGDGTASVDGAASSLQVENGVLTIGNYGNGKLYVTNGAEVDSVSLVIGAQSGVFGDTSGEVTVDGKASPSDPSTLSVVGIGVGQSGTGKLNIKNGGNVLVSGPGNVAIGIFTGSNGTVKVDNSLLDMGGGLGIGILGSASLEIINGGNVKSKNGVIRRYEDITAPVPPLASVLVAGQGSRWDLTDTLEIGVGALARAEVKVRDGGIIKGPFAVIGPDGSLLGDGTVEADVENNGKVASGNSPGTLHIIGDYTQGSTGHLEVEMASATTHDLLDVTGSVTLGGALDIVLLNGYAPSPTDTFNIIASASSNGAFNQVTVSSPSGGVTGSFAMGPNSAGFALSNFLAGDYNGDRHVDIADFVGWRKGQGANYTPADYDTWRTHFGQTTSSGAENLASPVPEPASATLLLLAFALAASTFKYKAPIVVRRCRPSRNAP